MLEALTTLIIHGDYITWWNTIGISEDSPLIDLILTITGR